MPLATPLETSIPTSQSIKGIPGAGLRPVRFGRGFAAADSLRFPRGWSQDLEFTYSLIDCIVRLSLGELPDFSGAKYDGDFSPSLKQAKRRKHEYIADQVGIGAGRRVLDLGCGWGPLLTRARQGSVSPCPRRRWRRAGGMA